MGKVNGGGLIKARIGLDIQHLRNGMLIGEQHKDRDLVVATGLQFLNRFMFDSFSRPTVFYTGYNWTAIGWGGTVAAYGDSSLWNETQRMTNYYTAAAGTTGWAYLSCTFDIAVATTLFEVGMFATVTAKTQPMYCRDTYAVKNVGAGDQVRVIYTSQFATT